MSANKVPTNKVPSALAIGIARGGLEVKQFMRQRESVVFTIAFPLILLAIFVVVDGVILEAGLPKINGFFLAVFLEHSRIFFSFGLGPGDRDHGVHLITAKYDHSSGVLFKRSLYLFRSF
jgi:hypothetical protein